MILSPPSRSKVSRPKSPCSESGEEEMEPEWMPSTSAAKSRSGTSDFAKSEGNHAAPSSQDRGSGLRVLRQDSAWRLRGKPASLFQGWPRLPSLTRSGSLQIVWGQRSQTKLRGDGVA